MGGPIVRSGPTPEYWGNWDQAFSKKKTSKKPAATKKPAAKKAKAKKKKS